MTTQATRVDIPPQAAQHIEVSVEVVAYAAILTLALALRVIGLGDVPLNPDEARQAIAALHLLSPTTTGMGAIDSLLIFGGAALSFAVATPTNAAARLVPMLAGVGLTLSPLMFRDRLGRIPTLAATLLIAISPTAVATSRQMTGVGLAMLSMLIALKTFSWHFQAKSFYAFTASGVALAVGLLADFGAPLVIVAMAIGFGFAVLTDEEDQLTRERLKALWSALPWHRFVIGFAATLAALGTLFFFAPRGLGAAADELGRFLAGIINRPPSTPYLGLVIAINEPLLIGFGLLGAWFASQSPQPWQRFLSGWGVASVLLSLIYPGALPAHSLLSIVPLAGLTALAFQEVLRIEPEAPRPVVWVHTMLTVLVLGVIFACLTGEAHAPLVSEAPFLSLVVGQRVDIHFYIVLLIIMIVLAILAWLVVASLWEPRASWQGLGLGLALPGLVLMLGQGGSLAFVRPTSPFEPLHRSPAQPGLVRLVETAQDVSEIAAGNRRDATITVQGGSDSVLAWALLRFTNVTFVEHPSPDIQSIMVTTPADGSSPFLGSSYVGQGFTVVSTWDPSQLDFASRSDPSRLDLGPLVDWLFYRTGDPTRVSQERVILWVREDIYKLIPQQSTR